MRICVIIPAYNEERTIADIVNGLLNMRDAAIDVLVVNDGSMDNTAKIAKGCGAYVMGWRKNLGKGVALRGGFQFAREKGYDGVIMMDGDGQHSVEDVTGFLEAAHSTNADIIIGNRMGDTRHMPLLRFIVNRVMSYILFCVIRQKVQDSQCGYRFIRRNALLSLNISSCNYDIESEMLLEAAARGLRIHSIPVRTIYGGAASYIHPLKDTVRFIKLLLRFCKNSANF